MRSKCGHINKYTTNFLSGLLVFFFINANAQLSPGDLAKAHAHLEGISNCTKCHVLGDKVSNDKCLECHKEIKTRISQKKGYHSSAEVSGKDCFACHSDHHGRNFDLVRFDEEKFNHTLTGYKLTGAHLQQDCIACHKDENIDSYELKKKETTYLGLKTDCVSCHTDVHQNTLSTNCASCHNTEAFAPAVLFSHDKTSFPLKGKHKTVDCKSCHEVTYTDGERFQKFDGVPFTNCGSCHEDPHDSQFGTNCKECHTEESFNTFIGKNTFNHNLTDFPLKGKHRNVDCASCHQVNNVTAENVFQDFRGKNIQNCATCHKDVHETRLGSDCRQCHTEESFQRLLNPDQFDHTLTGFALQGKHMTVDCRKCHETKMTDALPHQQCMDCHNDFHRGQFAENNVMSDCNQCHDVNGFSPSHFLIENHNESSFPLTGAHLATPCISCHLKNEEWSFRDIGQNCNDCHTDVHKGFISQQYMAEGTCINCHRPDAWSEVTFDHSPTGFLLEGKHLRTDCIACHKPDNETTTTRIIPFTGLGQVCASCHNNVHDTQFEREGITDCARCHGFEAWKPSEFDHDSARFVLDGAHRNVACNECHKEEVVDGRKKVLYRLERFECVTCHEQ